MPSNHDGGRVENLTAQRHENSVLFSLANLQQLAMPSAAAKPLAAPVTNGNGTSEGSGLIDIRAMAATTLGAPSASGGSGSSGFGDDLPTFGSFSAAAPVLLPIPTQSGPPKWIYALIGGMVLLVVGIAVMAYKILTTKPVTVVEQVQVPAPAPAPTAVAVAPKGTMPAAPAAAPGAPTIPDEKLPPREGAPGAAPATAAGDGAKHEKGAGKHEKGTKGGGKEKKGGASAEGGGKTAAPVAAAVRAGAEGPGQGLARRSAEQRPVGQEAPPAGGVRRRLARSAQERGRSRRGGGAALEERSRERHELDQAEDQRLLQPVQGAGHGDGHAS